MVSPPFAIGFRRIEHGFARLIAQARSGIDAPGRLVLAVDRELDRPGDALLVRSCRRTSASSGVSGRLRSAVACAILTLAGFSGASAGAASTRNSDSAPVPLMTGPGRPAAGSDRSAVPGGRRVMFFIVVFTVSLTRVLRRRIALRQQRAVFLQEYTSRRRSKCRPLPAAPPSTRADRAPLIVFPLRHALAASPAVRCCRPPSISRVAPENVARSSSARRGV